MNLLTRYSLFGTIFLSATSACSSDQGETLIPSTTTGGTSGLGDGDASETGDANSGSGGNSASTGGTGAGVPTDGEFSLLFRDDFDSLDLNRWMLMTHSWRGNLAIFSADAVSIEEGQLVIRLEPAPEGAVVDGEAKSFLGAEVRSRETITYGRVRTRARFAKGPAVVSSLVTIYTPWPADNWNELDIECLGKDPTQMQYNAMVYTGPILTPPVATSVTPTQDPEIVPLGFDSNAEFHEYTIEWTPAGATFSVDDVVARTWTENIALMNLPQNILLTIWASSSAAWAGAVSPETTGASAVFDWIEVSQYN